MEQTATTEVVSTSTKVLVQKPAIFGAAAVATVVGIVAFAMSIRTRGRIQVVETESITD